MCVLCLSSASSYSLFSVDSTEPIDMRCVLPSSLLSTMHASLSSHQSSLSLSVSVSLSLSLSSLRMCNAFSRRVTRTVTKCITCVSTHMTRISSAAESVASPSRHAGRLRSEMIPPLLQQRGPVAEPEPEQRGGHTLHGEEGEGERGVLSGCTVISTLGQAR